MITKTLQSIVPLILLLSGQTKTQSTLVSPCPEVFEYDHTLQYPGRWYGVIKLNSNYTLYGLWLEIKFDHSPNILKSCVGSVTHKANIVNINDPNFIIKAGEVTKVQIYIEYNVAENAPRFANIVFNGREICKSWWRNLISDEAKPIEYGTDTRGCPYRPETISEISAEKEQTTVKTRTISNRPEDDNDDPLGINSFVLPKITNYHNNSDRSRCGRIYNQSPLLIGEATEAGQWPWQVSITRRISLPQSHLFYSFSNRFACTGTVISTWHIITAAHCVSLNGQLVEEDHYVARAGGNQLRFYDDLMMGTRNKAISDVYISINDIILHPGYDYETFDNDLSILSASSRLSFSTMVQPACLPKTTTKLNPTMIGTVAGYGFDASGEPNKGLSTIQMTVVDNESCLRAHDPSLAMYFTGNMFCAKHVNGTSKCHNDSGGGMMIKIKNRWYLRGILSFYYSPELQDKCQSYALYTDVVKHLPWIKEHVYDYI